MNLHVVYFDQLLVAASTRKLVIFKPFSVISHLKSRKNVLKLMGFFSFCLLFKAGGHAEAKSVLKTSCILLIQARIAQLV